MIAYTEGFDPKKADKIKGWIEHNGAKHSEEITDDVTHLIVSAKAWNNYKKQPMGKSPSGINTSQPTYTAAVIEARRKRTIYLMRLSWLEDSLNFNKRKPLDEVNKKYTWEVEHAGKVLKKRKEKQLAARKEKARALRAEAKEAARSTGGGDQEHSSSEDTSNVGKMQQVVACGKLRYFSMIASCTRNCLCCKERHIDMIALFRHQIRQVTPRIRERHGAE